MGISQKMHLWAFKMFYDVLQCLSIFAAALVNGCNPTSILHTLNKKQHEQDGK